MLTFRPSFRPFFLILLLSFVYGMVHAVGPGHGKAVFSAWALAGERTRKQALGLPFAAAYLHAASALVTVAASWFLLERLAGGSEHAERILVTAAALLLFLLALREFVLFGLRSRRQGKLEQEPRRNMTSLGLVLSVGLVPCPISSVLLVFSFAAGLVWQGVVFVLAFATGMGLTMMAFAVFARFLRGRFADRPHPAWRFVTGTVMPLAGGVLFLIAGCLMLTMYC